MKAILTEGRLGEYLLIRADDPDCKPIRGILLLFPYEDRQVLDVLRMYGINQIADEVERHWKEVDGWRK